MTSKKANRNGESGKVPSRNERFFQHKDYWYYTTREGVNIGPFDSLGDASCGVDDFIEFIVSVEPAFVTTLERYRPQAVA